jgi:hypothetical protein
MLITVYPAQPGVMGPPQIEILGVVNASLDTGKPYQNTCHRTPLSEWTASTLWQRSESAGTPFGFPVPGVGPLGAPSGCVHIVITHGATSNALAVAARRHWL